MKIRAGWVGAGLIATSVSLAASAGADEAADSQDRASEKRREKAAEARTAPGAMELGSERATPAPVPAQPPSERAAAPAEGPTPISRERYVAAGLVGTVAGYGIGHAIAGYWTDTGYLFTLGEVSLVLFATLVVDNPLGNLSERDSTESGLYVGTLVAVIGLRLVEVVDIWTRPVVKAPVPTSSWTALPAVGKRSAGVVVVGSF